MFKNTKKILVGGLVLVTVLSNSTIGQAANFDCNDEGASVKGYSINSALDNYYNYDDNNYKNWETITLPSNGKYGNIFFRPGKPNKPGVPVTPGKPETPETPPITSNNLSKEELEVVRLVNIEREKNGLKPFSISNKLSDVAREKSKDMAVNKYFSHTSPTYGSPFEMMKQFGISYKTAGENIAKGYLSAQSVVSGWMNSPGHRANILNASFNTIGVGAYKTSNNTIYWTQMFTN